MEPKPTYDELLTRISELEKSIVNQEEYKDAVLDSKNKLRRLLDIVPYPILITDQNSITLYLNQGFTATFGWTLSELLGRRIPFTPTELKEITLKKIEQLLEEGSLELQETKRMAKDGRILDVSIRAAYYKGKKGEPDNIIAILRDITKEKKTARIKDAMYRISMALPKHTSLKDLLNYISMEVKEIIGSEGTTILLLDREKKEFFTLASTYDDQDIAERREEVRFSMDEVVATQVVETGEPIVVYDPSEQAELHKRRDKKLGYTTRNLLEVPLRGRKRIFGVLGAVNKKEGKFEPEDIELLDMIAGTVALSIENARVSDKLKNAYNEVTSLNRAKDKAINHLSHELRTPVAILIGSLRLLEARLKELPESLWKPTIERIMRNLGRIKDIEYEVDDIMRDKKPRSHGMLSIMLDQCADELETLIAEEIGEGPVIQRVREKVEEIFGPKEIISERIELKTFIENRIRVLKSHFSHREIDIHTELNPGLIIDIPLEVLEKVFDGLLKNAVENTPDESRIEIELHSKGGGAELIIRDYGVGISEENQRRIFEGFFTTQETMDYSSKRPFDFNAGGRGADLLRMKIFSERYGFKIDMESSRCPCLHRDSDICPGRISTCPFCKDWKNCHSSGGTIFSLFFPNSQKD